jgi:hypothetical protein
MMMGDCMFLLYDQMAYKLYHDDVDRVERASGKPVRDLSEDELVTAMKRLGIQKLEITPEDRKTDPGTVRYCIYCREILASNAAYCSRCGKPR